MFPSEREVGVLAHSTMLSSSSCSRAALVVVIIGGLFSPAPVAGRLVPTSAAKLNPTSLPLAGSNSTTRSVLDSPANLKSEYVGGALNQSRQLHQSRRESFRSNALRLHNTARRQTDPPAAQMPWLKWNEQLARLAETWSRRCAVEYGLPLSPTPLTYSGRLLQNVWSGGRDGTLEGAVSSWLAERRDFNYGTGACYRANGCSNYLTIMSASVHEAGCGLSTCANGVTVVCYYGARSQEANVKSPYVAGQPCSQCEDDEWCDRGLCRSAGKTPRNVPTSGICQCAQRNEQADLTAETDDSALSVGSSFVSVRIRSRRHTNGSSPDENTDDACGHLDIPLWIFVGLLVDVVFVGLLIGIFAMIICICKDLCKACVNNRGSRNGNSCCKSKGGSCFSKRCLCCGQKNAVQPDQDDQAEEVDEQETPTVNSSDPVIVVSDDADVGEGDRHGDEEGSDVADSPGQDIPTNAGDDTGADSEGREYQDIGVNTEPEPEKGYVDRSVCTDTLVTNEAGTCTEEGQSTILPSSSLSSLSSSSLPVSPTTSRSASPTTSSSASLPPPLPTSSTPPQPSPPPAQSLPQSPSPSPSSSDAPRRSASPTSGRCMEPGCQTCPLHTRDQREVRAERTKLVGKLIKAKRDKTLAPGTYIF